MQERASRDRQRELDLVTSGSIMDSGFFLRSQLLRSMPRLADFVKWLDAETQAEMSSEYFSVCLRRTANGTFGLQLSDAGLTAPFVHVKSVDPAAIFEAPESSPWSSHFIHAPLRSSRPPPPRPASLDAYFSRGSKSDFPTSPHGDKRHGPAAPPPSKRGRGGSRGRPVYAGHAETVALPPVAHPCIQPGDEIVAVNQHSLRELGLPVLLPGTNVAVCVALEVAVEVCRLTGPNALLLLRVRRRRNGATMATAPNAGTSGQTTMLLQRPPMRPLWSLCTASSELRREIVQILRAEKIALHFYATYAQQWLRNRLGPKLDHIFSFAEVVSTVRVTTFGDAALAAVRAGVAFQPPKQDAVENNSGVVELLAAEASRFHRSLAEKSRSSGAPGAICSICDAIS